MPYKDMLANEPELMPINKAQGNDTPIFQLVMSNNSPILPIWFTIMLLNILGLVLLF